MQSNILDWLLFARVFLANYVFRVSSSLMSRAATFLRLIVSELRTQAITDGVDIKIHDKDVAVLANNADASTFSAWLTDGSSNRQFTALLALLDYLPPEKVTEILGKILPSQTKSIKQAIEDNLRSQKTKKKSSKKKRPLLLRFSGGV